MPLRTVRIREPDPKICPRCAHELVVIDGALTKWLNCTNCKWRKLVGKESGTLIRVTPLAEQKKEGSRA